MTPVPQQGSLIWEWMTSETLEVITSRYLINQLMNNLANPRFRLDRPAQRRIVADYLKHASLYVDVPESGAYCRDIKDIPILDLAIWQQVDAIVTTDPDLLELDGEYSLQDCQAGGNVRRHCLRRHRSTCKTIRPEQRAELRRWLVSGAILLVTLGSTPPDTRASRRCSSGRSRPRESSTRVPAHARLHRHGHHDARGRGRARAHRQRSFPALP